MAKKDKKAPNKLNDANGDNAYRSYINNQDIPDDQVIESIFNERKTQHVEDAVDYEDIDELADEVEDENLELPKNTADDSQEIHDFGIEEEDKQQEHAEQEFDDIFGEDNNEFGLVHEDNDNHNIFKDLNDNNHLMNDDGMTELNMEIFDDSISSSLQKRPNRLQSVEERKIKRQKLERIVEKLEKKRAQRHMEYYYPFFSKDKSINFHQTFLPSPAYFKTIPPPIAQKETIKPLIPNKIKLEPDLDQKKLFKSKKLISRSSGTQGRGESSIVNISSKDEEIIENLKKNNDWSSYVKEIDFFARDSSNYDKFSSFSKDIILSTTDWDDDTIINAGSKNMNLKPPNKEKENLDFDLYDDDHIFNGQIDEKILKLDMNDPNLLFIPDKKIEKSKAIVPMNEKLMEFKFNVSNDKAYELLKNNYNQRVRSQLSNLNIEHSMPALRLQSPYYKVKLNKDESRMFHRPKFMIRPGTLISFSKLKLRKKKKDRGKSAQEIFNKSSDLTVSDTGSIIGMEYSEEYPHLLSNFGMGSKLINYYRKERPDDTSRPKAPLGETHVLGVEDRSPFWNFGEVAPGDFVPALYNNMLRAPVFKHEMKNTDFLLLRSQGCGNHQRYYLRNINFMFAVGNIFPAIEVPAPHSRKVTNTSKNRLKMIVFRAMNNNNESRVSVKDISHHFPDQNDMQNRQRLKEFMEYQRHGDDQGFWKIKNSDVVPTEDEIRAMVSPEDICILDSMQHGQQVFDDTILLFDEELKKDEIKKEKEKKDKKEEILDDENEERVDNGKSIEREKEKEKDKEKDKEKEKEKEKIRRPRDTETTEFDLEEELTPWNSSRNFVNANQTKTMLQLNGEGDPSGIGLGFSFLRSTQKNTFHPLIPPPKESVPKNNTAAYQQKLYEAEIKRIWYSQRSSLVDHGNGSNLDVIYNEYKPINHSEFIKKKFKEVDKAFSNGKVLRITRRFRDENNIVRRRVDTISDTRLIKAYINRKKQIEDEMLRTAEVDDIIPTNDKELNKIRRKALEEKLASLEKKAKQNKLKKPIRDSLHAAAAAGGTIIDANTVMLPDGSYFIGGKGIGKGKSKTRRCASCGAFGHIRTNKSCPLYNQTNGGTIPVSRINSKAASATPDGDLSQNIMETETQNEPEPTGEFNSNIFQHSNDS